MQISKPAKAATTSPAGSSFDTLIRAWSTEPQLSMLSDAARSARQHARRSTLDAAARRCTLMLDRRAPHGERGHCVLGCSVMSLIGLPGAAGQRHPATRVIIVQYSMTARWHSFSNCLGTRSRTAYSLRTARPRHPGHRSKRQPSSDTGDQSEDLRLGRRHGRRRCAGSEGDLNQAPTTLPPRQA